MDEAITEMENSHRMNRMDENLITKEKLDERCRGCHKVDDMRHEESTSTINRLATSYEKHEEEMKILIKGLTEKLEKYVPPAVHWTGKLETGALGFTSALCCALIVKVVY